MGLDAAAFTLDVYVKPTNPLGAWVGQTLISQGDVVFAAGTGGWQIYVMGDATGANAVYRFITKNPVSQYLADSALLPTGVWYYIRCRITGRTPGNTIRISVNAGAEVSNACTTAAVASAEHLWHGRCGGATHRHWKGAICYVHAWNIDKGALGAVPATPFAVDANTVGRWIHSDGAGAQLTDTSGNANHGAIAGAAWSATVPAGWTI